MQRERHEERNCAEERGESEWSAEYAGGKQEEQRRKKEEGGRKRKAIFTCGANCVVALKTEEMSARVNDLLQSVRFQAVPCQELLLRLWIVQICQLNGGKFRFKI